MRPRPSISSPSIAHFSEPFISALDAAAPTNAKDDPNYYSRYPRSLITTSHVHNFLTGTGSAIYDALAPLLESTNHELILVTCFWARSASLVTLSQVLRRLSDKAIRRGTDKIRVRLYFSSLSLFQKLFHKQSTTGQTYPSASWVKKLGLPDPSELGGLDLRIKSIFILPFSVMHPKFIIIDRKKVVLPSCNISWEEWFEGAVTLRGPVVDDFLKFFHIFWEQREDGPALPTIHADNDGDFDHLVNDSQALLKSSARLSASDVQTIFLPSPHRRNPLFRFFASQDAVLAPPTPLNIFILTLFTKAERSIRIQSPNITAPPVLSALLKALTRGIDVQILTSERLMILEQLVTAGTTTSRCIKRLFPSLRMISRKTASIDIFTAVSRLNGPLPVYHPQLLSQCVLAGKLLLVQRILIRLYQKLKFWSEDEELESTLEMNAEDFSHDEAYTTASRKDMHSSYADFSDDREPETVTEEVAINLKDLLTTKQIPLLSSREQFHLADIVECIGMVEKHRRSIDDNAGRFLLFFRQHALSETSKGPISWREIIWAFHSGSQDILLDLVSRHFNGKMMWQHAKECGVFMWMTDLNALRAQFEVIARNEYTKTEEKNPVDCALYYLALRKKAVLVGLWRMATWSKEQGATHRLLSNNFNEERWKTAALKNAYALMGRRRFEYAASFFLLADHLQDAVSVLHNQLGDTQLAIAVARVYGGDDSPVLLSFLKEKILPQAARDGNRWLATWAYWLLNRRDNAVRSLVTPLSRLLSPPETPNFKSKSYLTDDPALVVLYKQLREKSLQTLRGATMVGMREEWDFVLHTAGLYERMGCDILALDLVRTWEFLLPPPPTKKMPGRPPLSPMMPRESFHAHGPNQSATDFDFDPRKLLRRRSSLVVSDLPTRDSIKNELAESRATLEEEETEDEEDGSKAKQEDKPLVEEKKKPPPTQFQEPDANSLLDAFGF